MKDRAILSYLGSAIFFKIVFQERRNEKGDLSPSAMRIGSDITVPMSGSCSKDLWSR